MNRLSRVVVFSSLILSGYSSASFAADYLFLKTPPQTVQGIDLPGTLNILENALGGVHPALTFSNIPAAVTSQVYLFKNGECLDQGNKNRVGVGANATGSPLVINADAPNGAYTLTLSVNASATATTCSTNPLNPVPIRFASIAGTGIPEGVWTGTYDVYRLGSVPEPGSLALLGLGLSALVFVRRRKAAQH